MVSRLYLADPFAFIKRQESYRSSIARNRSL